MTRRQRWLSCMSRLLSVVTARALLGSAMTCLVWVALPAAAIDVAPGGTATFDSAFADTSDGVRIHYLHGGRESPLPTVVFVPGWTWSGSIWTEQMQALAPSRRVVAIDPRSQGESSRVTAGNTPEARAEDLHMLLAQLGTAPVVLVGWSQGVQDIAAYINLHGTQRVAGLVLVDAAFAAGPASFEVDPVGTRQLLQRIPIYARYPNEYLAGMIDASLAQPMGAERKSALARAAAGTPTDTGIAMLVSDLLTTDRRDVARKIDRPMLVMASATSGELDALKQMAQAVPGARLSVVPGAGHAVFIDQPKVFESELARFLDGLAGMKTR